MSKNTIHFDDIGLPVPDLVMKMPYDKQCDVYNYLKKMGDVEKKAYLIAKEHLGSSFNICKSNGYKEWKKKESAL
jgi:hypothetical protein